MKYSALIVALAALTPASIYAQNAQYSDCRTLQAAGNFVGPDEAIVNGLACKVGKPKTNSTMASGKSSEGALALLGILTPESLRSKEKTGTKAPGAELTPGATPGPAQSNSAAGGGPQKSLGEIARAYRKDASVRVSTESEQGNPGPKGLGDEKVDRVAFAPQTDKTAVVTTVQRPLPSSSVPEPPLGATKAGKITAAPASPSLAASDAPRTAKTEVTAVPQAKARPMPQESSPEAPKIPPDEPGVKSETSLPAAGVKSVSTSDLQAPTQAAIPIPGSAQTTPTKELTAASPAPSATAATFESKPELLPSVGSLAVATATNSSPEFEANNNEEDAAFREGQGPACRKNVSLGSMDKDKLFLAIPVWALQWLEKNQKRFPGICFSDSPMSGAKNYLVVFYMAAPPAAGTTALKNVSAPGEMTPASRMGSFTTSYGFTWHYTYDRTVTTTITSSSAEKAPHNQASSPLYVTAYSEQGIPISHHSSTGAIKQFKETSHKHGKRNENEAELAQFRLLEESLEKMVKDVAKL